MMPAWTSEGKFRRQSSKIEDRFRVGSERADRIRVTSGFLALFYVMFGTFGVKFQHTLIITPAVLSQTKDSVDMFKIWFLG